VGDLALDPRHRREVPDVSAIADPATSGQYVINGGATVEGGTSQAAPIWAGIMALVDQYLRRHGAHRLGFANPALYALARGSWPYPAFHDVTLGTNLYYPATAGYDMASGLGTPNAWNLARDLLAYSRGRRP
jgi:kumamolisin